MSTQDKIKQASNDLSNVDNAKIVDGLRGIGLDDEKVLGVLNIISNSCKSCFDGDYKCQCWNDE